MFENLWLYFECEKNQAEKMRFRYGEVIRYSEAKNGHFGPKIGVFGAFLSDF